MTRLILCLMTAILTFGFGVALERFFISPKPAEVVQSAERCDPSRIEVRTIFVPPPPAPSPTPHVIFDLDPAKFDTNEAYLIAAKMPNNLAEFRYVLISSFVNDGKLREEVSIYTQIDTVKGKYATFALVTHRRVVIVGPGSSNDGVEYRFDGEFLYKNISVFANKDKPVLRGTLTKSKNGQKVAEAVVSFSLEQGHGC